MLRAMLIGMAVLLSLGAGASQALPPPSRPIMTDRYFQKLANDWVQLYLGRSPTQREVALIVNQLRSGASANAVQANILGSDEYYRRNNRNLNTWARSVVADVLGRPITIFELSTLQQMAMLNGRIAAARLVLDSQSSWVSPPWWWF